MYWKTLFFHFGWEGELELFCRITHESENKCLLTLKHSGPSHVKLGEHLLSELPLGSPGHASILVCQIRVKFLCACMHVCILSVFPLWHKFFLHGIVPTSGNSILFSFWFAPLKEVSSSVYNIDWLISSCALQKLACSVLYAEQCLIA